MKSKDQQLLEEMYEQVKSRNNFFKLKQDEQGLYRPEQKSLGSKEFYKNRFYRLYDSKGNKIPQTTPLEVGQIVNRERGVYFKVSKEGEEFVAEPISNISSEIKSNIETARDERIAKDKEQAMAHFFPKNTNDKII